MGKSLGSHLRAKQRRTEVEMMCETLAKHAPDDPFTIFNRLRHSTGKAAAVKRLNCSVMRQPASKNSAVLLRLRAVSLRAWGIHPCAFVPGQGVRIGCWLRIHALDDPDLERVWLDLQEG